MRNLVNILATDLWIILPISLEEPSENRVVPVAKTKVWRIASTTTMARNFRAIEKTTPATARFVGHGTTNHAMMVISSASAATMATAQTVIQIASGKAVRSVMASLALR